MKRILLIAAAAALVAPSMTWAVECKDVPGCISLLEKDEMQRNLARLEHDRNIRRVQIDIKNDALQFEIDQAAAEVKIAEQKLQEAEIEARARALDGQCPQVAE